MQEMHGHGVSHRANQGISVCVHVILMLWKDNVDEEGKLDAIVMNGSAEGTTRHCYTDEDKHAPIIWPNRFHIRISACIVTIRPCGVCIIFKI